MTNYKMDTDTRVCFYEQEFYVLSNFSSFKIYWKGLDFDTSEAVYHWEKFPNHEIARVAILKARSAHEAFKLAQSFKDYVRPDWKDIREHVMLDILRAKVEQHEYVKQKLLQTGNRELVEDSWRDDYWGWGPNKDGQNILGKLWMHVRDEVRMQEEN